MFSSAFAFLLSLSVPSSTAVRGLAVPSSTAAKARTLRALCQVARVHNSLHAARERLTDPGGRTAAELAALPGSLVGESVSLARSLRALTAAGEEPSAPTSSLHELRAEASILHAAVAKQQAELEILEEEAELTSCTDRARSMFELLDANSDGTVDMDEFVERATLITPVPQLQFQARLSEIFVVADSNRDGALDFNEFASMLSTLSQDALGPLRETRATSLARLLNVTLEMTQLTLARELDSAASRLPSERPRASPARLAQLERCVDRWCDLGEQAEATAAAVREEGAGGGGGGGGAGAAAEEEVEERCAGIELMLEQVGDLASELSMTNVTTTAMWSMREFGSQALRRADASLRFCWRGLRIFAGDVAESAYLVARLLQGRRLTSSGVRTIKRTLTDAVALVPYTIIMVIPLSPPGHVFAFSLLNRCFPAAVPSAFTAQRQDIDEIYSRIAAEAPANEDAAERRQLRKEISSKLAEVTRAGVGLVTRVPGRARRAVLRRMGREAAA